MTDASPFSRLAAASVLGSGVALAGQALMALLLLKLYSPEAVGEFSVVAQIAFAWASLALAQTPLTLLTSSASQNVTSLRSALRLCVRRWIFIAPFAIALLVFALQRDPNNSVGVAVNGWIYVGATAMALVQAGWFISQSIVLRKGAPGVLLTVRAMPPVVGAILALFVGLFGTAVGSTALIFTAVIGFTFGCYWILEALTRSSNSSLVTTTTTHPHTTADPRSESLKLVHTMSDVAVSAGLAAIWAAQYGPIEAGYLLLTLRILGFIPALVASAWGQVALSQPLATRPRSVALMLLATGALVSSALGVYIAIEKGWLAPQWAGIQLYLLPIGLWQWSACFASAFSFRPFLVRGRSAAVFSRQCVAINAVQLVLLLVPVALGIDLHQHLWSYAATVAVMLLAQAWWAASIADLEKPKSATAP